MRRIFGWTCAAMLIAAAPRVAEAQMVIGMPNVGVGVGVGVTYGYGMPYGYGMSAASGNDGQGYGYGPGYGSPYGGFGWGYGPGTAGAADDSYSARFSAYVPLGAPAMMGGLAAPMYASGYRTSVPFSGAWMAPGIRNEAVVNSPFLGPPRPNGGLVPLRSRDHRPVSIFLVASADSSREHIHA